MSDEWTPGSLGKHLTRVRRKVAVEDGIAYPAVSVQMYGRGIGAKPPFVGGESKYQALFRVRQGDVVLRTITAFEAPAAVARAEHDGSHVSSVFITYEIAEDVLPGYLALFFQSQALWDEMKNRASGTVLRRKTISDKEFQAIPIAIPPLAVQERIVDVIAAVDDQVAALDAEAEAQIGVTSGLRSALLTPGRDWTEVRIGDVAIAATGRAFPDKYQGHATGQVPYFKVADLNGPRNDPVLSVASNWLDAEGVAAVRPRVCPRGTVVFPILGAALATEKRRILGHPSAFDQNLMGLILGERVLPDFMLAVMSQVRLAELTQNGAVPSVNQGIVSAIRIHLPPLAEQESIGRTLDAPQKLIAATRAEADLLRVVRASLLNGLLNRDIEIADAAAAAERVVA
ncbi:restriction endonuclease subunit S [Cellulomonas sp. NTE-D12]|uniref:restriction endonuclease subunit S n=1 Tax=Cellulomonas sp. NTE-D12 TaxID=2962632 RepID=UPI00308177DF|nr:hypothetical protein CELD12_26380 [Cellulomonas sp. NTE-D12]